MEANQPPLPARDLSIDILRGFAVLFMIVTHSIVLFYSGTARLLDFWVWWGATICYSSFLFAFSAVYGMKLSNGNIDPLKHLKRATILFIGYYLLAMWAYAWLEKTISITAIKEIITFQRLPMFTEFIPAFGFFILIILLTQRLLRKYIDQPSVFILASFVLYIAGIALVHFDTTQQAIKTFIALFAGDLILHTFGILSYFPIFIIGLVWGANKHNFRDNSGLQLMVTSVVMLFIVQVTQATSWERWPPSLLFLLFGLSFSLIIVINREFWQKTATLLTPITYIGQHAFYFYVLHLAILLPISSLFISKTANFSISVGMVFICLISAYLIQYFLHRTTKNH